MNKTRKILLALFLIMLSFSLITSMLSQEKKKTETNQEKITTVKPKQNEKESTLQEKDKAAITKTTVSQTDQKEESDKGQDMLGNAQQTLDRAVGILSIVATSLGCTIGLLAIISSIVITYIYFQFKKWAILRKEVNEEAVYIRKIRNKIEEEYKNIRKKTAETDILSLTKEPTKLMKEKLDEFSRRLELFEIFGLPLEPEDYLARGGDFYNKGEYENALIAMEKVIELKPDHNAAWNNKGIVLDKLGRNEEALEAFNKSIELKPDESEMWHNKGVMLNNFVRYEEALEAQNKSIELKPDYADAWDSKGITLNKLNRYEEALEAFNKSIELKPDNAISWDGKGITLSKLGRHEEALEAHKKAVELKPDYANAWFNKACLYSLMNNKDNALKDLSKAIEIDNKYKEIAKTDKDFQNLWDDDKFKEITS